MPDVLIAGVGMVPFSKPGRNEPYDRMGADAVRAALDDAGLDLRQVGMAFGGYVYGDSCAGQAALYNVGMTGVPVVNVNNNCASGSTAFALAAKAVRSGQVDCALAFGFEEMPPGAIAAVFPEKTDPLRRHTDAVADLMGLSEEERALPPAIQMFGCQVELLHERYGVTHATEAAIVQKARRHARDNPNAIFRSPISVEEILAEPFIFRGLRRSYACAPSCGAAAVLLSSPGFAKRHGLDTNVALKGSGWCSDREEFFTGDPLDVMFKALSETAAVEAYEEAGIEPRDVDVCELHDCFTSNELITYSALGFCGIDEIERFVADGNGRQGSEIVIGPSGGLLAKGHPLGATGLAQINELVRQLRRDAGPNQVPGARIALQHNGGLGSAGIVNIFERRTA